MLRQKIQMFATTNEPPTGAINIFHGIDTGDHKPINSPKYQVSNRERPIKHEHIQEMLKNKIIEPS